MATESKQSGSAKTALIYLTIGALMDVWTALYYFTRHEATESARFWCAGFFCTGLVLVAIGLAIGRIGRSARGAEVAPTPDVMVAPATSAVRTPAVIAPENATVPTAPVPDAMAPITTGVVTVHT